PRRFGSSVLRFVQEHAVLLVLTAFILATAVGLWRLVDSPDLYQAVVNLAIGAYALGLVALALMIRRLRRIQALLKDAEARRSAIVETVADGILTLDERGLIESCNAAAGRIFGYTADEVVGRHISMLLSEMSGDARFRAG